MTQYAHYSLRHTNGCHFLYRKLNLVIFTVEEKMALHYCWKRLVYRVTILYHINKHILVVLQIYVELVKVYTIRCGIRLRPRNCSFSWLLLLWYIGKLFFTPVVHHIFPCRTNYRFQGAPFLTAFAQSTPTCFLVQQQQQHKWFADFSYSVYKISSVIIKCSRVWMLYTWWNKH